MSSILTNPPRRRNPLRGRGPFAKKLAVALPLVCACALPMATSAYAQGEKDCPPGSWFCGETTPPPAGANKDLQPLPPESKPPPPPPVVIYQPPPTTVVVQPREAPPPYLYTPRKVKKRAWGLNLHIGGLMIGSGARAADHDHDTGMAMIGLGLRLRPVPAFAVEADLDFAGGRDYNGYRRRETAFAFNGLVFLNPRSKTQVYLLGGFGWSGATAVDDRFESVEYKYGYFGGQGGVGLEFRLSQLIALNIDMRGFVRSRIDSHKSDYPEFVDRNGRTTNTSGGGIMQGGLTFYW